MANWRIRKQQRMMMIRKSRSAGQLLSLSQRRLLSSRHDKTNGNSRSALWSSLFLAHQTLFALLYTLTLWSIHVGVVHAPIVVELEESSSDNGGGGNNLGLDDPSTNKKRKPRKTAATTVVLPPRVEDPWLATLASWSELLLPSSSQLVVPTTLAEPSLLFWSAFEFSMDAALYYLGPVDNYLREGTTHDDDDVENCEAGNDNCPSSSASSSFSSSTIFFEELMGSVEEWMQDLGNMVASLPDKIAAFVDDLKSGSVTAEDATASAAKAASYIFGSSSSSSSTTETTIADETTNKYKTLIQTYREQHPPLEFFHLPSESKSQSSSSPSLPKFFSLFQKGDGSETDLDGIPTRFLEMHKGNRALALQSLVATVQWRQEHNLDTLLLTPHVQFDISKAVCPHYFLGRDQAGDIVFMLRPALIDLELASHNQLSHQDMLRHYVYVNEYLWQILEYDKPLGTMTSIMDLTGLQFSMLSRRDMLSLLQLFVSTMDAHFPQRAHKTLILNAPTWVGLLYRLCTPWLRESTMAKIELHSVGPGQDAALLQYLNTDETRNSLPSVFWHTPPPTPKPVVVQQQVDPNQRNPNNDHNHNDKEDKPEGELNKNNNKADKKNKKNKKQPTPKDDELATPSETVPNKEATTKNKKNESSSSSNSHVPKENSDEKQVVVDDHDNDNDNPLASLLNTKLETDLRAYVVARLKEAGKEMLPVIPLLDPKKK
ncbi:hypothetical protein ACA910_019207 [Epithemia clementina (nom. ined.)]